MNELIKSLKQYLDETLRTKIEVSTWKNKGHLPIFLIDAYYFFEAKLLGVHCLLISPKEPADTSPGTIRKHSEQIQKHWEGAIIYVQPVISSYNRKRLIEQHVPFIVPGNQMYLPHVGIDFREYFKKIHAKTREAFTPSTQAVILYALLCKTNERLTPSLLAEKLGYTVMTMTRAFHELHMAEVGEFHQSGRERYWTFSNKKALWEEIKHLVRSPIRKRMWLKTAPFKIAAGLSALSHVSQLTPPPLPVFAIGIKQWEEFKQSNVEELPTPDEASLELEIWNYNPELFAKNGCVDPFSLYLSLEINQNERIEAALEKMMEKMEW